MQRTYGPKRDAPGGLEPRDVLFSVDDKQSAFDAFFIKSIKQTKRELSCVGSANQCNAGKKVRKRKYVRRIVKEVEPTLQESLTRQSTYLTPDKSIRVNKPKDLFDELLNSSLPGNKVKSVTKEDDLFSKLCENKSKNMHPKKIYYRKIIKKFNCSSDTSSDSDKENSFSAPTRNISDIRKHEFVIEKVIEKSPISPDDSIHKIVNDMSLLKQLRDTDIKNNDKYKKKFHKNRLTRNYKSPNMQNSPLCSTPCVQKYRSRSIYNFSPISMDSKDDENPDPSVIIDEEIEINNEVVEEMLTDEVKENDTEKSNISNRDEILKNISSDNNLQPINDNKCLVYDRIVDIDCNNRTSLDQKHSDSSNSIQNSAKDYSFLGFSNQSHRLTNIQKFLRNTSKSTNGAEESPIFQVSQRSSRISVRKKNSKEKSERKSSLKAVEIMKKGESSLDKSSIEMSVLMEPLLGFSETTKLACSDIDGKISNNNSALETTILENCPAKLRKTEPVYITVDMTESGDINLEDFSSASGNETMETENESNYDTCSSVESFDVQEKDKVPVIFIKKMNDSLFNKYYENMSVGSTDSTVLGSSDNDEFIDTRDDEEVAITAGEKCNEEIEVSDKELDSSTENSSTEEDDIKKHVSFVTTRRKNMVDDSILMVFDESRASTSSSEFNQTVLSNKFSTNLEDVNEIDLNVTAFEVASPSRQKVPKVETLTNEARKTVLQQEFDQPNSCEIEDINTNNTSYIGDAEIKAPIVLQPGKKWERSLSIYRRLTTMEETMLEDAEMKNKGRKYRQSVICTMESQERGPLHNESVVGRRNTIVPKQHRSTIRIVKDLDSSRVSLNTTAVYDDLTGFLSEDCDDTLIELSKLSIADEHEITVLGKVDDPPERVTSARDYVLRRCDQADAVQFDECYPETLLKNCHKIGEGVYGEVYLYRARDGVRVMKIVPVAGDTLVNGEHQKDFQEVISEIVIAMELSALRAPIADVERLLDNCDDAAALDLRHVGYATDVFNEVLAVRCVTGAYPSRLLDLWDLYDETKGSENDNPAALPADQQYIVLELANAGHDLESYQFNSAEQAYALFLQVAYGLAVGEEAFQFEHRDLHWGNVLIAPTDQKFATFVVGGRAHRVPRRGVAATIIDYSLSRLALPLARGERAALYNDLASDQGLFAAAGDRQFEVYRLMRERLSNDWKSYDPHTNVLWLHYTADKMVTALRYKRTNTKTHRLYLNKLRALRGRLLRYRSAAHFVLADDL